MFQDIAKIAKKNIRIIAAMVAVLIGLATLLVTLV